MAGCLYVVATPIGHLRDLSRRAEDVLSSVAIVAAEDTRRTSVLLAEIGASPQQLIALHTHNERRQSERVLGNLTDGQDVALVSDAGTPCISDPGFELVRLAHESGIRVVPVPGASAVSTLLSAAPLPVTSYRFVGFLASKGSARNKGFEAMLNDSSATVFFEAPHRMEDALRRIGLFDAARELVVGRELTKVHEEILLGPAGELSSSLKERGALRGEFVCLLSGMELARGGDHELAERILKELGSELPPSKAARIAARISGVDRSLLYERLQQSSA